VNASIVHPRDVFAPALEHNATAVIVAHNHPSGSPDPSPEDFDVTGRLKEAAKLMGISFINHIIVTKDSHAIALQNP
jgi:DNA repair protein RadC